MRECNRGCAGCKSDVRAALVVEDAQRRTSRTRYDDVLCSIPVEVGDLKKIRAMSRIMLHRSERAVTCSREPDEIAVFSAYQYVVNAVATKIAAARETSGVPAA